MSTSVRFRIGLLGAGLAVVALCGALLYFGRGTPRGARSQRGADGEVATDGTATTGAATAASDNTSGGGGASRSRKPLESAWRWLLGDKQASTPPVAGAGGADPGSAATNPGGADAPPPTPRFALSERRPARDPGKDDSSPTLAKLLDVTQATAAQEPKIRELWRKHEEARRQIYARMMPSVAPPEVKMKLDFEAADGEMEIAMIRDILDQHQADRLVAEMHPPATP